MATLGGYLDLSDTRFHRALDDAYVVMKLFQECREKLGAKVSVEEMAQFSCGLRFSDYSFDQVNIPPDKADLKTALDNAVSVEIRYMNSKGEETLRKITPYNIYSYSGKTYVAAFCHQTEESRQFRMDRICEVLTPRKSRRLARKKKI